MIAKCTWLKAPQTLVAGLLFLIFAGVFPSATRAQPAEPVPMVVGWGDDDYGQASPPPAEMVGITAISAGISHSAALNQNGGVIVWGHNWAQQRDVPPAAKTNVIAIAAGGHHTLALKKDGSVVAWGWNSAGQTNVPASALSGVIAITVGVEHSVVLKSDGSVMAWGGNSGGQSTIPEGALSGVTQIVSGPYSHHNAAIKSDGSLVVWGGNGARVPVGGLNGVKALAAGYEHTAALKNDGSVVIWTESSPVKTNIPPAAQRDVIAISAGFLHTLALKADGSVVAWGTGRSDSVVAESKGQTTVPDFAQRGVVAISAGGLHNLALLAPVMTGFPSWQTRELGEVADFRVGVSVTPVSYQWRKERVLSNGQTVPGDLLGETNAFLRFTITHTNQAGDYSVLVRNSVGAASNMPPARLTVIPPAPPTITSELASETRDIWQPFSFTVTATGGNLSYQWVKNGFTIPGATNATLSFQALQPSDTGDYSVLVSNSAGMARSAPARLTVNIPPPVLQSQPSNVVVNAGEDIWLHVSAYGATMEYQWFKDGIPLSVGDDYKTLTNFLHVVSASVKHAGAYTVVVRNSSGSVTSVPPAMVTVITVPPPTFFRQPTNVTVNPGESFRLQSSASGQQLDYRWFKDGVRLTVGTNFALLTNDLYVASAGLQHAGGYTLVVSNPGGSITSSPPALVQVVAPAPQITGQSTNLRLGVGDTGYLWVKANTPWASFQWRKNDQPIPGATNSALGFESAGVGQAGVYTVVVSSSGGSVTSAPMTLTLGVYPPAIAVQPKSQIIRLGETVTLSAQVTGGLLSYQWRKDGSDVLGATNSSHVMQSAAASDAGVYTLIATNVLGSVTSVPAMIRLRPVGAVVAWGNNQSGQVNVPLEARSGIMAVAAGSAHTLALKTNGAVLAWGHVAQTNVPLGAQSGVTAIAAGLEHSVALRSDGSVVAWGDNIHGQVDVPESARAGVIAITAGQGHTAALKDDGSVIVWGEMLQGSWVPAYVPPEVGSGIQAIAAGSSSMAALTSGGSVLMWGRDLNIFGPRPSAANSGVTAIASGWTHILALKENGSVLAWGSNYGGETRVPVSAGSGVIAVAGGASLSVALKMDGSLSVWGAENISDGYRLKTPPLDAQGAAAIAAGATHLVALVPERLPTLAITPTNRTVEVGHPAVLSALAQGYYLDYQWRKNGVPISGANAATHVISPATMSDAGQYSVVVSNPIGSITSAPPAILTITAFPPAIITPPVSRTVHEGQQASLFAAATGSLLSYQWLKDGEPIAGATSATLNLGPARTNFAGEYTLVVSNLLGRVTSAPATLVVDGIAGASRDGGAVLLWANEGGAAMRVPVEAQSDIIAVATGGFYPSMHTLALKIDGTVVAWGSNGYGQAEVPAGLSNVVALAAGSSHSVALKTDGTLVSWGSNERGENDIPPTAQSGVVAVTAGGHPGAGYTAALKADGSVIAWGAGEYGVTDVPAEASGGVIAISGSPSLYPAHLLAVKSDGSVLAWGSNEQGESDVPAAAQSGVVGVAAGAYHSLALKADGSVIAWGQNGLASGALPPEVSGNVVALAAGYQQSVALKKDGSMVSWGGGPPLNEPSIKASAIAAGPFHSTAIVMPTRPAITRQPSSRTVASGQPASFSVAVSGYPLAYQWRRNGVEIPAATGFTLNLGPAQTNDAGEYTVVASNSLGSVTSAPVRLDVHGTVATGAVLARGGNDFGQSDVPVEALEGVMAIAAGEHHSLALKVDGSVLAWGYNDYGQSTVPDSARSNVTAIAAGLYHSAALKSDGSVLVWGNNDNGQLEIPEAARSGVVAISALAYHTLALRADGSLVSWPFNNTWGQPEGESGVTAVAPHWWGRGLLMKEDGSVIFWQREQGEWSALPYVALTNGAVAIAAGIQHGLILKQDGSVQRIQGEMEVPSAASNGVVRILAGGHYSFAFKENGTVVGWGVDPQGQDDASQFATPGLINVAGSPNHTLILGAPSAPGLLAGPASQTVEVGQIATLTVWAEGFPLNFQWSKNGVPIPGATSGSYSFQVAQSHLSPREQSAEYSVIVTNHLGSITNIAAARVTATAFAPIITKQPVSQTTTLGQGVTFSVEASGTQLQFQWRRNGTNIPGANGATYTVPFPEIGDTSEYTVVVSNFLGSSVTPVPAVIAVHPPEPGAVVAWGAKGWPIGTPTEQITIPLGARSGVSAIAVGVLHTLALKSDGTIVAWGNNEHGQSSVPPDARSGVSAIIAGFYHNLALKNTGSVVAWGRGWQGETTVPPGAETDVTAVAAGEAHSVALKKDGSVLTWGQLANNGMWTPAAVPAGLTGVKAISAGAHHGLALKHDGTLAAWGYMWNGSGWEASNVPAGLAGVTAIAAGNHHAVALKGDGSVVAWGRVWNDGWTPAIVPNEAQTGVVRIEASWHHTVAYKEDGSTVTWGLSVPVPAALQGLVTSLDAGDQHIVGLLAAVPLAPSLAVTSDGNELMLSWPDTAAGYTLQYTTNLGDPNSWRSILTQISPGQSLIDSMSGPARFYRLKKP